MILTAFEALIASFFPAECQGCGKPLIPSQSKLCQGCFTHLSEHDFSWQNAWHPDTLPGIRCAWSALPYRGVVQDYLRRIKFKHEFYLLDLLVLRAKPLFDAITAESHYDAVIPMPIDFPGRWSRRYNQTEILAASLCQEKKVPIRTKILYKRWGFRPQHGLGKEERKWNLFGAFRAKHPKLIQGKSFLLIDDIITTGATASEAARALLNQGAMQVDLFTLARSEKQVRHND